MTEEQYRPEILIVEDSATQAQEVQHALERRGYRTVLAKNGSEALDAISGRKPDLVLSDIVMPGMNGFELCKRLKSDEKTKAIPMVLLTSLTDSEDVLRGLECGADSFITKPYDEEYLLSRIDHVLLNREPGPESNTQKGIEIRFNDRRYIITTERRQILDLLLSTYEAAVLKNRALEDAQRRLRTLNERLEQKVDQRTGALIAEIEERKKAETELEKYRDHLEELVRERTTSLEREIEEHKRTEERLSRAKEQLENSNKQLQEFAYVASHDLKQPLRSISGFMELLRERYEGKLDPEADRFITFAVEGAQRMSELINDLLAYSRVGTNGREFTRVSMESVLARTTNNLIRTIEETDTAITHDPLPEVSGDATQLVQLLQNLIENSIKFRKKDQTPRIRISAERKGREWIFGLHDNGIGIESKFSERIFGMFQRLHTKQEYPGTGIGLAVCRKIIERHGGRIYAESRPGEGASFYFTLPALG